MPDIVTTWGKDRGKFWDYKVTDEEIANEWGPWEFKTRLPELHNKNKVYVCHDNKIKGFNTIKKIWKNDFETEMKVYSTSWVVITPQIPIKRCIQGWIYFKNIKKVKI